MLMKYYAMIKNEGYKIQKILLFFFAFILFYYYLQKYWNYEYGKKIKFYNGANKKDNRYPPSFQAHILEGNSFTHLFWFFWWYI